MNIQKANGFIFLPLNTLRFKISVLYVAIIGIALILIQTILYFNYVHSLSDAFDAQLEMKAEQIGGAVNTFRDMLGNQQQAFKLAAQKALNLSIEYPNYLFMPESSQKFWLADARKLGLDKDYLVIMDDQGQVVTESKNVIDNLWSYLKQIGKANFSQTVYYKFNFNRIPLRIVAVNYYYNFNQSYKIIVGSSYLPIAQAIAKHLSFVIVTTILFLVMASLIVRLFVIRVLSSVMEISEAARSISQDNLSARIRLTHADAEIDHLTGSLNKMIGRLEKSFNDVKEFSLEMAHEVKTPLALISAESQLALQDKHTPEEYRKMFRKVLTEAKRTQRFVSDLLLLTKLDYRLVQFRFETIDFAEFLREICEEIQVLAASHEIDLQGDIALEKIMVKGDRIHLRRVFYNLIDNAFKNTPANGCIMIKARQESQSVVCSIKDNGCGIAQDELSKIFYKFYSSSMNHGGHSLGCGLGLSIVQSIVAIHGGSIKVQSELGQGTRFIMEFPLEDKIMNQGNSDPKEVFYEHY